MNINFFWEVKRSNKVVTIAINVKVKLTAIIHKFLIKSVWIVSELINSDRFRQNLISFVGFSNINLWRTGNLKISK